MASSRTSGISRRRWGKRELAADIEATAADQQTEFEDIQADLQSQVAASVEMAREADEGVARSEDRVAEAAKAFETIERITHAVDDAVETARDNRERSEAISERLR